MTPVALVHDRDADRFGEDHSTDRSPATGLAGIGDAPGSDARNRERLGDPPRAAIPPLGRCDDFGRIDVSWLYAPDEGDNTPTHRPTIPAFEDLMEEESLPLGLAVS
jgi:hypothetical protein